MRWLKKIKGILLRVAVEISVEEFETTDGRKMLKVKSPYTPQMPGKARGLGGKWDPDEKVWFFDIRDKELVLKMLYEVYGWRERGTPEPEVDVIVKFLVDIWKDQVWLFGRYIKRPFKNSRVYLDEGIVIQNGDFGLRGGSRRHPAILGGGVTLLIHDVPLSMVEDEQKKWEGKLEIKVKEA